MNIKFLESFVWLARLKNFRATAEKLNTTQPNISNRLAALEGHFNVKLYVRGAKEFELTAAGRRLFEHAERIVEMTDAMDLDVSEPNAEESILRVGIIETVTMTWFPSLISRINQIAPEAAIEFTTGTSPALLDELRRGEIDLALIWGPANEPHIANVHICSYAVSWLCNPAFFDCAKSLNVVELAKMPLIMSKKDASGYAILRDYFHSHGVENVPDTARRVLLNCSYSIATSAHLTRLGLGIVALPPIVMADDIQNGVIAELEVGPPPPPIYITACYKTPVARGNVLRLVEVARETAEDFAATVEERHFWV